jgi:hypothetical protein
VFKYAQGDEAVQNELILNDVTHSPIAFSPPSTRDLRAGWLGESRQVIKKKNGMMINGMIMVVGYNNSSSSSSSSSSSFLLASSIKMVHSIGFVQYKPHQINPANFPFHSIRFDGKVAAISDYGGFALLP